MSAEASEWTVYLNQHGKLVECEADGPDQFVVVQKRAADAEREVVEKERDAAVLKADAIAGDRPDSAVLFCTARREGEDVGRGQRERLLDLLEGVEEWLEIPDYQRHDDLVNARGVMDGVKALLDRHRPVRGVARG
jgi:hypothetical protein